MSRGYTVSKRHPCACGCGRTAWGKPKYAPDCPYWLANKDRIRAAMLARDKLALTDEDLDAARAHGYLKGMAAGHRLAEVGLPPVRRAAGETIRRGSMT